VDNFRGYAPPLLFRVENIKGQMRPTWKVKVIMSRRRYVEEDERLEFEV
jgi:hypothetical protein